MNALFGLHVVVTRPQAQARSWAQQLEAEAAQTTLLSVMEITPLTDAADQQKIKDRVLALADYQKVIFVSQNAVTEAAHWIEEYWPQAPVAMEYFAIGTATAKALQNQGVSASTPSQAMNSEDLLSLPALQNVADEKVLIFRGRGGRPLLAEQLQQRGARVDFCELYQRLIPTSAAFQLQQWLRQIDIPANANTPYVIAVHSGESLANLNHLIQQGEPSTVKPKQVTVGDRLRALPLLVPSERVADRARELGFDSLIVADNATDDAMTEALIRWYKQAI